MQNLNKGGIIFSIKNWHFNIGTLYVSLQTQEMSLMTIGAILIWDIKEPVHKDDIHNTLWQSPSTVLER